VSNCILLLWSAIAVLYGLHIDFMKVLIREIGSSKAFK